MAFLIAAYGVVFVAIAGYRLLMARRRRALLRRTDGPA
jgi:CcmD family protein